MCKNCKVVGIGKKRKASQRRKKRVSGVGAKGGSDIMETIVDYGATLGGAMIAQELGQMVPAETLSPDYVEGIKILAGTLAPSLLGFNQPIAKSISNGFAVQGGLTLVNKYLLNKPATTAPATTTSRYGILGWDNGQPALAGYDNAYNSGLAGVRNPNLERENMFAQ